MPRTRWMTAFDAVSFVGIAAMAAYLWVSWGRLPDRIVGHFGAGGRPDRSSVRAVVLVFPGVAAAIFVGFLLLRRIPQHFNFPVAITEANAARQYTIACEMLACLSAVLTWGFAYAVVTLVRASLHEMPRMEPWIVPAGVGVIFATIALFLARMARAR